MDTGENPYQAPHANLEHPPPRDIDHEPSARSVFFAWGSIGWVDLTVPDAPRLRDFDQEVVGWTSSEVPMGEYADFCVHPSPDSPPVAGIRHVRGRRSDRSGLKRFLFLTPPLSV